MALRIGLAEIDYTPAPGLPLMGNFRDDYAARGVHDPLYARALVVADDDGREVAILVVDICMLSRENVAAMRGWVQAETGIPGERVLIAATHSHAAPAPTGMGAGPEPPADRVQAFLRTAAGAVAAAQARLKPRFLTIGRSAEYRVSFIRRLRCQDGRTHMNWEQLDPAFVTEVLGEPDYELQLLGVEDAGRKVGAIVNFGLHPAVLAGDNWLYSADYPGYLAQAMKRLHDADFVNIFANAPCGNVNHIDYRDPLQGRGIQMTQRIGHMLAIAALEAQRGARPVHGDELAVASRRVPLPRLRISPEQQQWARDTLDRVADNPSQGQVDGLPDDFYARRYLQMAEVQDQDDEVEVMAIRLGDVGIVGFPGELFCEFGKRVKAESPAPATLVIELANDAVGYLPTREAFDQGGYEPSIGSTRYQPGAGDTLADAALGLLDELFD